MFEGFSSVQRVKGKLPNKYANTFMTWNTLIAERIEREVEFSFLLKMQIMHNSSYTVNALLSLSGCIL